MARQYQVGEQYINETDEREYQVGGIYLNETQAAVEEEVNIGPLIHMMAQSGGLL